MKVRHYLLILVLIVISFFAGTAWKSGDTDMSNQHIAQDTPIIKPVSLPEPVKSQPQGLSANELATIALFEGAAPSVVYITTIASSRHWSRNVMQIPSGTGSGFLWSENGHS